jgi:hypothetical protein
MRLMVWLATLLADSNFTSPCHVHPILPETSMTRAEAVVAPFRGGLGGGKVGVAGGCEGGGGRLTPLSTFIANFHTPLPEVKLMQITYLPVSGAESITIRS